MDFPVYLTARKTDRQNLLFVRKHSEIFLPLVLKKYFTKKVTIGENLVKGLWLCEIEHATI